MGLTINGSAYTTVCHNAFHADELLQSSVYLEYELSLRDVRYVHFHHGIRMLHSACGQDV